MDNLIIFLFLIIIGVFLETFISQPQFYLNLKRKKIKSYKFSLKRYLFFLLFPFFALIFVFIKFGFLIIKIFFISAIICTFFEWCVGFSYHLFFGKKLWIYDKYHINQYTSWLSIPLWGLAGVLFYLIIINLI